MNLKEWLDEQKPAEGDECEFMLDGKEYRAWISMGCGYITLSLAAYHIGESSPEFPSITKLTLLRPEDSEILPFFPMGTKGRAARYYNVIGTWTKPEGEEQTTVHEFWTSELHPKQIEHIREIVREELARRASGNYDQRTSQREDEKGG